MNSTQLYKQSQIEENDFKSLALQVKALREKRSERFKEDWLPLLNTMYSIEEQNFKYTIITQDFGTLDYFPKANKLLIRRDNKWIKPGLRWIINNLFN